MHVFGPTSHNIVVVAATLLLRNIPTLRTPKRVELTKSSRSLWSASLFNRLRANHSLQRAASSSHKKHWDPMYGEFSIRQRSPIPWWEQRHGHNLSHNASMASSSHGSTSTVIPTTPSSCSTRFVMTRSRHNLGTMCTTNHHEGGCGYEEHGHHDDHWHNHDYQSRSPNRRGLRAFGTQIIVVRYSKVLPTANQHQ